MSWDVVRKCQDLLAGFMGIGSEKSISVMVCDIVHGLVGESLGLLANCSSCSLPK